MKFTKDKKATILLYLLDKIEKKTPALSKCVADTFEIGQTTVHAYLNELIGEGVIEKSGRGQYALVTRQYEHLLRRSHGELASDTYAFDECLKEHIADLPENAYKLWEHAFTEMANNVIDHSEAENMHVLVVRNYLSTTVLIMDDGVGIFDKIKNHFSLGSLDEAICELFKGKLTTDEANHSGEGIFFSSKMMDTFLIVSDGKIFATSKYNTEEIFTLTQYPSGTCVFMSLSNFTHRTVQEVYEGYATVDDGFTKTHIPLKNVFDAAPVSRSQAKRVCYRLDKFKEVTLDFDDISWIGQGFAHQLFVVYARSHPETKLIPVNMNEAVTNMYYHVTRTVL
ncbi:MAG: DUF4325 domain-containing protein [Clostridia bacterium]|nr:DUF4325 domain-containing protein [Clostridia bacterium]